MEKHEIFSPAKINLHLRVLDKRPDGFHNLESIFVAVDFGDTLYFEPLIHENSQEIIMEGGSSVPIPIEKNIVFKALSLFREKTGFYQGLKITINKSIPFGSGLGGGSSNAASALLALNKIAGLPLKQNELLQMAAILGSDVPFFIYQTGAARVSGRGEYIEPFKAPQWFFVLVNPGFPSDTAQAFHLIDQTRVNNFSQIINTEISFSAFPVNTISLHELKSGFFYNDFLPVFNEPQKSVYNNIILKLQDTGAMYASLSGSGSTCFGVFQDKKKAEDAVVLLKKDWGIVKLCKVI